MQTNKHKSEGGRLHAPHVSYSFKDLFSVIRRESRRSVVKSDGGNEKRKKKFSLLSLPFLMM